MRRHHRVMAAAAAAVVLVLAAPADGLEPDRTAGVTVQRIRIVDFRFRPRNVMIQRRDVVKWRNTGSVGHTTTSDDGLWDSDVLAPGETFRRRFRRRGVYDYHCVIHPRMTGTITVV